MEYRFGEINIICTKINRSLAFYHDVLGFKFIEEDSGAVRLKLGDQALLLLPFAKAPAAKIPYCAQAEISFDLLTSDLSSAAASLAAANIEFEKAWEEGADSIVIKDPDGLRIEVIDCQPDASADG